ncbi:MFS transporter [Solwaraspora sp. WMMD937]|uniref:MFS transporter n=1 Tax=Solwaraspora sp. WMMD937 TaxID=3016090 RepID=UPI00249BC70B|nr:MFS transporter [Solwaraspora sp. WMMD937]WFE21072.1 MFS transporter [Solwaraspora sp. WMMD937]
MTTAETGSTAQQQTSTRAWLGLAVLLTGTFVAQVDFFIVNVAIPSVQADLGATLSQVQLIAVSYGAAYAVAVITGGRLGDLYGRKRIFMIGVTGFAVASLLCGTATDAWVLIGARVVQGAAAALLMPQAIGSLHAMFAGQARERAFAVFGVSMGMAWVSGIVLGGLLLSADIAGLGWRAIFLINVPLAAVALTGAALTLTESRRPAAPRPDLLGMATLAVLLGLLIVPLILGRQAGWPAWSIAGFALSAVATVVFVAVERRVLRRGDDPVLSPDLFRDRTFRLGLTVIVVFFLGPPGFFLLTTLYLQVVAGFTALQASLSLLPFGVTFVLTSQFINRVKRRLGDWTIVLGCGVMAVAVAGLATVVHTTGEQITLAALVLPVLLLGTGQALVTTPLYEMLLRNVRREIASTASAVFTTVQLVAQSLSVVIVTIIFAALAQARLDQALPADGDGEGATRPAVVACADEGLTDFTAGTRVSCPDAPPTTRTAVEAEARAVTAVAARQAYVGTFAFNLLVLVVSGAVVARRARR